MKRIKLIGVIAIVGAVIGIAFWWQTTKENDPLNESNAFVYRDTEVLSWFEVTSRNGKVKGKLFQHLINEEIGSLLMEEKEYVVTGHNTDKGYELKVNKDGEIITYDAWFSNVDLLVEMQGEKEAKLYKAASVNELDKYKDEIQQELLTAIDQQEEKFINRINKFFTEIEKVHGYLSTTEDGSYLLFIKIDEALREGELTGSLLMMENTENNVVETTYDFNGITDGLMLKFYTTVDGKTTQLEGDFHDEIASGFDLSIWTSNERLPFIAITEEEFKQSYEEFKR